MNFRQGLLFVIFVIGCVSAVVTILIGSLWLGDEVNHAIETQCNVTNCVVYLDTCRITHTSTDSSGHSSTYYTYYTCYKADLQYQTIVNRTIYYGGDTDTYSTESSAWGRCNDHPKGSEMICYYNSESPGDSLTSSKGDYYAGALATTIVFGLITLFIFAVEVFYCMKTKDYDFV